MGGNVERHIGDDDRDGAAIEALQPGGFNCYECTPTAQEAVAAAYEAAATICADQFAAHMTAAIYGDPDNSRAREAAAAMAERLLHSIRALTPAEARAEIERLDRATPRAQEGDGK